MLKSEAFLYKLRVFSVIMTGWHCEAVEIVKNVFQWKILGVWRDTCLLVGLSPYSPPKQKVTLSYLREMESINT